MLPKFISGTVIFLLAVPFIFAQTKPTDRYSYTVLNLIRNERMNLFQDSIKTDKPFRMKKSPWGAVARSAILPGFGQFYNESYWKIPFIAGFLGYFGYMAYDNNKQYKDYRNRYSASQTPENMSGDLNLKTLREFYRDQRDEFLWFMGITYLINLIDAYVDAHLYDFDVSDEKVNNIISPKFSLTLNIYF